MEEFEILSNEEKAMSVRSKIKNIQYVKYNTELDIIEESAVSSPDQNKLAELNNRILDLESKELALRAELETLV